MGNDQQSKSVEQFAKLLSLGATICFVGSATYWGGRLLGMGGWKIAWYITFADFLNRVPLTVLIVGLTSAGWVFLAAPIRAALNSTSFNLLLILGGFASLGGVLTAFIGIPVFVSILFWAVLLTICCVILLVAPRHLGLPFWAASSAIDGIVIIGIVVFWTGLGDGIWQSLNATSIVVCAENRTEIGGDYFPIERGIVLQDAGGYRLIPWGVIKKIDTSSVSPTRGVKQDRESIETAARTACKHGNESD